MSLSNIEKSRIVIDELKPATTTNQGSSLIVDCMVSRSKKHHHRLHRSSVITTTNLSSCSIHDRPPIRAYHSIETPPTTSPTYVESSPLNDLRHRLASIENVTTPSESIERRISKIVYEKPIVFSMDAASPKSAPASYRVPEYYGHIEDIEITPTISMTLDVDNVDETISMTKSNQQLTKDKQNNDQYLQVADVGDSTEANKENIDETSDQQDPIKAIKQISSSSSSASASSSRSASPAHSPILSRQSSDCDKRISLGQNVTSNDTNQHSSSSSSSSTTSSRRLIRRRTVRRSYHHRALETDNKPSISNSLFVTTTTTTNKPNSADSSSSIPNSSRSTTTTTTSAAATATTTSATATTAERLQQTDQQHNKVSTSTSSSKIATTTSNHQHHKRSTQTLSTSTNSSSSRQSTSNRKTVSQKAETQPQDQCEEDNMISTSHHKQTKMPNFKGDNNEQQMPQQQQQRSLFERRSRLPTTILADIERAETGSVEVERAEESSVHRRELSSFESSSRLHRHHQSSSHGASASLAGRNSSSLACESSSSASLSRSATKMMSSSSSSSLRDGQRQLETSTTTTKSADSASHHHHHHHQYKSVFLSSADQNDASKHNRSYLKMPGEDNLFSSPDVRSLAQELGTDFAELESALCSTNSPLKQRQQQSATIFNRLHDESSLASRLFGTGRLSSAGQQTISLGFNQTALKNEPEFATYGKEPSKYVTPSPLDDISKLSSSNQREALEPSYNSLKIRQLLNKTRGHSEGLTNIDDGKTYRVPEKHGESSSNHQTTSPTYVESSPLNDLRHRLASIENVTTPSESIERRISKIVYEKPIVFSMDAASPKSAPASYRVPEYYGHIEDIEITPTISMTLDVDNVDETISMTKSNQQLTKDKQNNDQYLQVADVGDSTEANKENIDETSDQQDPIKAIKQISSSSSSASASSSRSASPAHSPILSRQSSDCDKRISLGQNVTSNDTNQHSSSSSSSSTTSSRRLIRRRTVRRSYHHRALETDNKPSISNSLFVTTTTTTNKPNSADSSSSIPNSSRSTTTTTTSAAATATTTSATATTAERLQQTDQQHNKVSTSTSSSKIATTTSNHQHHKRSTQTLSTSTNSSSSRQSTSNRKTVSQKAETQPQDQCEEDNMISTSHHKQTKMPNFKGDNNEQQMPQQQQQRSLFERRSRLPTTILADIERAETGSVEVERAEESSVHRRELSSFESSSRLHRHHQSSSHGASASLAGRNSSSLACESSSSASLSRSATKMMSSSSSSSLRDGQRQLETSTTTTKSADSASHHHHHHHQYKSVFLSSADQNDASKHNRSYLKMPGEDNLFSSPDVRSLAQELGTDFAELESALCSTNSPLKQRQQQSATIFNRLHDESSLASRLFGTGRLSSAGQQTISLGFNQTALKNEPEFATYGKEPSKYVTPSPLDDISKLSSSNQREALEPSYNSLKIRQLLNKTRGHSEGLTNIDDGKTYRVPEKHGESSSNHQMKPDEIVQSDEGSSSIDSRLHEKARCKAVMNESIVRIDQKMSDLCRKLENCNDTQKAIDLLKIMIQMIEKAWSVPVCGDDLGFKLCTSLRQFGGLDLILGFIHEADQRSMVDMADCDSAKILSTPSSSLDQPDKETPISEQRHRRSPSKNLKLNLSKIRQQEEHEPVLDEVPAADDKQQLQVNERTTKSAPIVSSNCPSVMDNDSDILTSDLGLDSTSVESLSYVSATAVAPSVTVQTTPPPPPSEKSANSASFTNEKIDSNIDCPDQQGQVDSGLPVTIGQQTQENGTEQVDNSDEMERVRRNELVFLSAHLLSQCLTSENRDYIVKFGLDPVIKLACNYTMMKSGHSKRLLKRSELMRQSSTIKQKHLQQFNSNNEGQQTNSSGRTLKETREAIENNGANLAKKDAGQQQEQRSDLHSAIGTEILQHLFKHSEETCWRMISMGALQAILYGCRSSHIETLRHCASALANLALYGGPDSQQMMIEQKAHVWLFPLAFNEDDNVQYYACLAIVVLAANQEIEADVLQSSTLDLVDPFVTSHEPRRFAESTTSHIHGQSAVWLKKLMPLLESKREEARNLACFHFAMEAHIKREQGQTSLFKEIGSIELLKKAGSSPIAIASKFACQALRLIGEKEPHKLSQQVPLWTCEDVCEWINQIGFEKFQPAFRDSFVDGDLLLQLDEQQLKFDIGIENGIIRRRFLRELSNLKRIADYSSVDRGGLSSTLLNSTAILNTIKNGSGNQLVPNINCSPPSSSSANRNARDFMQYIYPILKIGITKDNIHLVDCEQLLTDCKISNALHRLKLAHAIHELQDRILLEAASTERDSLGGEEQKTLDVFVSYRRSTGSQLASLLKVHLQLRGFSVFIDVERLEAGKFDNNLLESIKTAKNFILVLSPNALDRCIGDHERKDWVHKEIVAAMESKCNIIPIIDNFHWPDPEQLPEDMRSITTFNGIRWIHDYQDACVEKVERFIRGELNNQGGGQASGGAGSIISSVGGNQTNSGGPGTYQRLSSTCNQSVTSVSTPSIIATTPSLCSNSTQYNQTKNLPPNDHSYVLSDSNHHPLSAACTNNLYLQQNFRAGNSNNNVRLQ